MRCGHITRARHNKNLRKINAAVPLNYFFTEWYCVLYLYDAITMDRSRNSSCLVLVLLPITP
jgi:hypothetical protein